MKRILAFLLISVLLLLSGCVPADPPVPVLDFTATMYIDGAEAFDGNFDLQAEVTSSLQGACTIKVTTPDELWGLCYKWSDGFEMIYNGLHCQTEKGYLPKESFAEAVYSVLSALSRDTACDDYSEGAATFSGECKSGNYTVTTDSDGYIQNISIEEIGLSADFLYA